MFVLIAEYLRPLEEVLAHRQAHRDWLTEQYAAGRILVSGPMVPPPGGVIVARADSREELDALIATDPNVSLGIARYHVHEFAETPFPSRSAAFDAFAAAPVGAPSTE
jgi:uncharacterized protein YciI